ncbi:MAG: Manganese transport system membrane protein MntB [Chlamydiae bacterium]|nr:Manganese transport system membrane protein MntB [Chlamydiota bacterium]
MEYYNPYSGQTFFGFFVQLAYRFWAFLRGDFGFDNLASDEVQILVLVGVAVSSALLGSFLVLRKMTMLANALSHTILLGIVLAYVLTTWGGDSIAESHYSPINIKAMLAASLLMGIVTTFLTEVLTKNVGLQEDASIGIVFTSLFALGVILVTVLTRSAHIGTEVVMGNVDALQLADCKLVFTILGINLALFFLFFKEFKITTFDSGLSKALGISPVFFNYLLMMQVSATAIGAFRAVGVLMVLAFITGPALTARLLTNDLKKMLLLAAGIGIGVSIVGVALSRHLLSVRGLALSTGGVVVCVIVLVFAAAFLYHTLRHRVRSPSPQGKLPEEL